MKTNKHSAFQKITAYFLTLLMVLSVAPAAGIASVISEAASVQSPMDFYAKENEARVDMNFNKNWKFKLGAGDSYTSYNSDWQDVDLPHDFSITQAYTTIGTEYESGMLPGGTGWYQKLFTLPTALRGKRIILNFDGSYKDTTVYVNGEKVGENHYGYNPFSFDITEKVNFSDDDENANLIAVKVENQLPSSRWYSGSGLNRDVTLTVVNPVHVSLYGTSVKTSETSTTDGTATTTVKLQNDSDTAQNVTVKAQIFDIDGKTSKSSELSQTVAVSANGTGEVTLSPVANSFELWDIDKGNLYIVRTTLSVDGDVVDTYDTKFGYRTIRWDSNTGFYLNGNKVKIQGVCIHQDSGALGAIQTRDAIYRQVSILKDMGVNAIRTSHNISSSVYLDVCAELGVLVMEEFFDGWGTNNKNGNTHDFKEYFNTQITNDNEIINGGTTKTWAQFALEECVLRDRSNPAVFIWSIGNELGDSGDANSTSTATNLCKWARDLDDTRAVTLGDNDSGQNATGITSLMDVAGGNYHPNIWSNKRNGKPFVGTETASAVATRGYYKGEDSYSSVSHVGTADKQISAYDASKVSWGNTASDALWYTLANDWFSGEFVWTGFDYLGEPTPWNGTGASSEITNPNSSYFGICDTAGFAKDTYYLYRSIWNKNSKTLHLVPGTWDSSKLKEVNGYIPVNVYSNADKIELILNDSIIATATATVINKGQYNEYRTWTTESNSTVCSTSTIINDSNAHDLYAQFGVQYTTGTLEVKAYTGSAQSGYTELDNTVGTTKISSDTDYNSPYIDAKVWGDTSTLSADGDSYAYIEYTALSEKGGDFLNDCNEKISVSLAGSTADCEIAGVDNGNPATRDKFQQSTVLSTDRQSAEINLFNGKALVIVKINNNDKSGVVRLNQDKNVSSSVTIGGATFKVKADDDKNEFEEVCPQNLATVSESESLKNDVQAEYENINTSAEKDIEYVETDEGKETGYKYKKVTAKSSGAPIEDGIYVIYNPKKQAVLTTQTLTYNQSLKSSNNVSISGNYINFNSDFASDCELEFKNVSGNQYTVKILNGENAGNYLYVYSENDISGNKYIRLDTTTNYKVLVSVTNDGYITISRTDYQNCRMDFYKDYNNMVAGHHNGGAADDYEKQYLYKKTECSYLTYNKCIPDANNLSRPIEDGTYIIYNSNPQSDKHSAQAISYTTTTNEKGGKQRYLINGDNTVSVSGDTLRSNTDNEYLFTYSSAEHGYSVKSVLNDKYLNINGQNNITFSENPQYLKVSIESQLDSGAQVNDRVSITNADGCYIDFYSDEGDFFGAWNATVNDNDRFTLYRKPLKAVEEETAKTKSYTLYTGNTIEDGNYVIYSSSVTPCAVTPNLGCDTSVSISDNKLISSDKNEFEITKEDSNFYIKTKDGGYLSINGSEVEISEQPFAMSVRVYDAANGQYIIHSGSNAMCYEGGEFSVYNVPISDFMTGKFPAESYFTLYTDGEVIKTPEEVAKEALYAKIGVALAIEKGNYSDASYNAMLNAVREGINVYNNSFATETAITAATNNIESAISALTVSTDSGENGVVRTDEQTLVADFGLPIKYNITGNTESVMNENFYDHQNNSGIQQTTVKTYEAASAPAAGSAFNTQNISMPRASVAHSTKDKASFTGSLEDLSKCLVVYDGSSSIHFKSYTNLYVYLDANNAVSNTSNNTTNNVKHFYDRGNGNYAISNAADGRCLYFHTDTLRFNAGSASAGSAGSGYNNFLLFRPAKLSDGDTSSNLIPGYVQVTGNVPAGEYLIVHTGNTTNDYPTKQLEQYGQNYYVLYPSNASTFENVGKICIDTDTIVNVSFTNIKDGYYTLNSGDPSYPYLNLKNNNGTAELAYSASSLTWRIKKVSTDLNDNHYYVSTKVGGADKYITGSAITLAGDETAVEVTIDGGTIKLKSGSNGIAKSGATASVSGSPQAMTPVASLATSDTTLVTTYLRTEGTGVYHRADNSTTNLQSGHMYVLAGYDGSSAYSDYVGDKGAKNSNNYNVLTTGRFSNITGGANYDSRVFTDANFGGKKTIWVYTSNGSYSQLKNLDTNRYIALDKCDNTTGNYIGTDQIRLTTDSNDIHTQITEVAEYGSTGRMYFYSTYGRHNNYSPPSAYGYLHHNGSGSDRVTLWKITDGSEKASSFFVYEVTEEQRDVYEYSVTATSTFNGGTYSLSSGGKYLTGFDDKLALNSDITAWDFTKNDDGTYYISTSINGSVKYLDISGGSVSWSDSPVATTVTYNPDNGTVVIGSGTKCVKVSGKNVTIGETGTAFTLGYVNKSTATDKPVFPGDAKFASRTCLGVIKGGEEAKLPTSENALNYSFTGTGFTNGVCTVKGKYGTFTVNKDGLTVYTPDTMQFTGEDTFYVVSSVENDPNFVEGTYMSVEKITYIPATTVYYEDNFGGENGIKFINAGENDEYHGRWETVTVGTAPDALEQAADLVGADSANAYGYDPNYDYFATYSGDSVHHVSVGKENKGPYATASFTFAGTGFDIISLTGNTTGVFTITVKNHDTGKKVKSYFIDTYYGCTYAQLYYDETNKRLTHDSSCAQLYRTDYTNDQLESLEVDQPDIFATLVLLDKNNIYTTDSSYGNNPAYGWLADPNSNSALYQIPVMHVTDLAYGVYDVTVEARYLNMHAASGVTTDYFDLYFDAVRIYNPTGPQTKSSPAGNATAAQAYILDREAYFNSAVIKDLVIGDSGFKTNEGAIFIDGGQTATPDNIESYKNASSNNELYLSSGQAVAFEIWATDIPTDIQIGAKLAFGTPELEIRYGEATFTKMLKSATDMYYSLDDVLEISSSNETGRLTWTPVQQGGKTYYRSGSITVGNNSASGNTSILSLTNIKWTFGRYGASVSYEAPEQNIVKAPMMLKSALSPTYGTDTVSVEALGEENEEEPAELLIMVTDEVINTAKALMKSKTADLEIDESSLKVSENSVKVGENVTINFTTSPDVNSIEIVDANSKKFCLDSVKSVIENEDGKQVKKWTVLLTVTGDGEYVYNIKGIYEYGYASSEKTVSVTVNVEKPEPSTEEPSTEPSTEPTTGGEEEQKPHQSISFLDKLIAILDKVIAFLKSLFSFN